MSDDRREPRPLDDPELLQVMRGYLRACDQLAAAGNDNEILERSEIKTMAGMALRKRLAEAGWTQPARQPAGQRTTT